ncbi:MAG TPA: formate dehydrogenase accessory sulfurtransferase FdhD [Steroidobacteraceae bacterium]|nr:formate dehydrogenase accessory sulfurtransferase FdhD [Steroidobacteraceae bacterium]
MEAVSEAEASASSGVEVTVERWTGGSAVEATDRVAEEVPVALLYNGEPHVVMLATPHDLADLARGFSLSEELVDAPQEIRGIEVATGPQSAEVRVAIAWERFPELLRRRRNLTGRTGCGLCGSETLEQTVRSEKVVGEGPTITAAQLHAAIEDMPARQLLNARTGSVHAAAWVVPGAGIACLREDVGRHNALDKTLGALVQAGTDLENGLMLVTSRASYEMVQKAATMGVTFMAAMSAPTSFAIRHAQRCGLTLVAFARRERHVVYANGRRLVD